MFKLTACLILLLLTFDAFADNEASPCDKDPSHHLLDFWIGDWNVQDSSGEKVGENKIEKILNGCAVIENWIDLEGHEGKSFFYYNNPTKEWKQIWVEDSGGMKEKIFVEKFENGAIRFRGNVQTRNGSMIQDQTTLTPLDRNHVRQVIEISRDEGKSWVVVFDAIYVRKILN